MIIIIIIIGLFILILGIFHLIDVRRRVRIEVVYTIAPFTISLIVAIIMTVRYTMGAEVMPTLVVTIAAWIG